jgi:hypothetical protein
MERRFRLRLLLRGKQLSATKTEGGVQMPMMKISHCTIARVRAMKPSGFELSGHLLRLDDGSWLISITDEVAVAVASERVLGESDDGVVSRMMPDWPAMRWGRAS